MSRRVTIVMYHYVRDLRGSKYPDIKGLDLESFRGQIAYIQKHYQVITTAQLIDAVRHPGLPLPPSALLLTFDDGFVDHYENVLPVLKERGLHGCFFPPVRPIEAQEVLDVHKIHFILASRPDKRALAEELKACIAAHRRAYGLEAPEAYYRRLAVAGRRDGPDVVFVKRLLQVELPEKLRALLTHDLFCRYVSRDEREFARELYMSGEQIRALEAEGMTVGLHGYRHYWMDSIPAEVQEEEIRLSLKYFRSLGLPMTDWVIGYPYGKCDESLRQIVLRHGGTAGMVDYGGVADLDTQSPLMLARLATNELPVREDAPLKLIER